MSVTIIQELNNRRAELEKLTKKKAELGRALAKDEFEYRKAMSKKIAELNIIGYKTESGEMKPLAITVCESFAKGVEPVATLRFNRDVSQFDYDAVQERIWQTKLEIDIIQNEINFERRGM